MPGVCIEPPPPLIKSKGLAVPLVCYGGGLKHVSYFYRRHVEFLYVARVRRRYSASGLEHYYSFLRLLRLRNLRFFFFTLEYVKCVTTGEGRHALLPFG